VSSNGYSPLPAARFEGSLFEALAPTRARRPQRYWLHALLLLLTLITTTVVGAGLSRSFAEGRPFDFDIDLQGYAAMWKDPGFLLQGLPFSLTLLTILMAHEMGHYLTARYYGVDASLPFFIPAPTLIGTLGAFIRIRSAILSKRVLFDIGIGGPLAGFAVLVGAPGIAAHGELIFGTPLILRVFEWVQFPHVASADIYLHPVARAAWVGVLATALNLLPIGQLDGGHILYAFVGERTRKLSRVFVAALAALGFYQLFTTEYKAGYTWLIWSVILLFVAMRHPTIIDPTPVGRGRAWLAVVALLILILSFTPVPVRPSGL
jgi:membrane-associated protease RseP (regulator of RpoE activity)